MQPTSPTVRVLPRQDLTEEEIDGLVRVFRLLDQWDVELNEKNVGWLMEGWCCNSAPEVIELAPIRLEAVRTEDLLASWAHRGS